MLWLLLLLACTRPDSAKRPAVSADTGTTPGAVVAPNILLLLADDMGQDAVGAYGRHPTPPPTPVIDGLAADGVRFRNAWAYPICSPTRAAILTGRYGRRHGVGNTINAATSDRELRVTEVLLPEVLAASPHGYASFAVGKWHLAGYRSPTGLDHPVVMGFDHFDGHMGNLNEGILTNTGAEERGYYNWEYNRDGELGWRGEYATSATVDDVLSRVDQLPEPWFGYVAFHAPHIPLHTPPEALSGIASPTGLAGSYRAMVTAMDTEIGRLLDGLDPEVRARTVVIFAGDNGTSEHGTVAPWRDSHAKNTPYEGAVTVPLIVSGPGVAGEGREELALVHLLDLFATVADLAEVDLGAVTGADGLPLVLDSLSLVPTLAAADAPGPRELLYTENLYPNGRPPYATEWNILRDKRWKLIVGNVPGDELFDLDNPNPDDGNEGVNLLGAGNPDPLTAEQQAAYDRLKGELESLLAEVQYEERE